MQWYSGNVFFFCFFLSASADTYISHSFLLNFSSHAFLNRNKLTIDPLELLFITNITLIYSVCLRCEERRQKQQHPNFLICLCFSIATGNGSSHFQLCTRLHSLCGHNSSYSPVKWKRDSVLLCLVVYFSKENYIFYSVSTQGFSR